MSSEEAQKGSGIQSLWYNDELDLQNMKRRQLPEKGAHSNKIRKKRALQKILLAVYAMCEFNKEKRN